MAIETTTRKALYDGDDSTTSFEVPFRFFDNSHLVVVLVDETTSEETAQTVTTHYTISGDGTRGTASVEFLSPPAGTKKVSIYRDTEILQPYALYDNESQTASNIEAAIDRLTLIAQELDEGLSRTVKRTVTLNQTVFPEDNLAVTDVFLAKITDAPTDGDHPFEESQPVSGAITNQTLTGGRTGTLRFPDNCTTTKTDDYVFCLQMLDTAGATVYRAWQPGVLAS